MIRPAPHWKTPLFVLLPVLAWLFFWYRETAMAMVTIWARSDTFAHGFIVPPIVLWLLWRQRRQLAAAVPQPQWWMLLPLSGLAFAWLLGELAAINALTQFAFTGLLIAGILLICGLKAAKTMAFPLAFLLLAVPFGDFMMPTLMDWTARFTVLGLRMSGIPVYQEGLQFVIPSGNWSVVEACSGVRYLIASFTVGTLFAYLSYRSLKRRLIFIAFSLAVPIVANWLRAYIIVMLGHLSGNKLAAGVDHLIYGWVFFGVVILLMFMIGARWAEPMEEHPAGTGTTQSSPAANGKSFWIAALLFAIVVALPHAMQRGIEQLQASASPQISLAATSGGWTLQEQALTDWKPAFQNPSTEVNAVFARDGNRVGLYLGYYRNQNYGRKLVSSENMLVKYKDSQWARVASGSIQTDFIKPAQTLRTAELRGAGLDQHGNSTQLVVWQIYWVNGWLTASDHVAKAYSAFSRLFGQGDESAVIILYAPKEQAGGGEAVLQRFAQDNAEMIAATLRHTREQR